jgi:hypothetical protein
MFSGVQGGYCVNDGRLSGICTVYPLENKESYATNKVYEKTHGTVINTM